VAKRVRGSHSTHRPGGLGPSRMRRASDAAAPTTTDISTMRWDAAIDGAIDSVVLETTEITIEEAVAVAPQARRAARGVKIKADSLEARVAAENVYVREDLHRIGTVAIILLAGLAMAWLLFVVLDVLGLY